MKNVIFSKYSNERARTFAIRTDILEDEGHNRTVRKSACYPEGQAHIEKLPYWYEKLEEAYLDTPISMNRCTLVQGSAEPEFVKGHTLEEELDGMLQKKDVQGCIGRLMEYIAILKKAGSACPFTVTEEFENVFGSVVLPEDLTSAVTTDIDMLVSNVIVTETGFVHMDYEWTFAFPIPVNFVIYRTLMYYMEKGALRAPLLAEDLYRHAGLTQQEIAQYVQMEAHFQQYILGESVPLRMLYRSISAGYVDFAAAEKQRKQAVQAENARLAAQQGKAAVEICVDTLEEASGMVYIKGWAVSRSLRPLKFKVQDHLGREWQVEEHKLFYRQDVNISFDIADPDYCAGFRIACRAPEAGAEKSKAYVLTADDGREAASLTLRTDRLRIKNSRVGKKLLSMRDQKPRHEIHYITPYERGLFGEKQKFHSGEQRYDTFCEMKKLTGEEKKRQCAAAFSAMPLISLIAVSDHAAPDKMQQMLESVCAQTYANWELWIACEEEEKEGKALLEKWCAKEKRIRFVERGGSFTQDMQLLLEKASGEYLMALGAEDLLAADALFETVRQLEAEPAAELLYTDEDSVDSSGKIYAEPLLKPDYNLYMLRSTNYVGHGMAVKKSLAKAAGGFREGFGSAWDYDFTLRCAEKAGRICHIRRVLYHCRQRSAAQKTDAFVRAKWDMGKRALVCHYQRMGVPARVEWAQEPYTYRTRFGVQGSPKVSVIIPNMDHTDDLEKCVRSIADKTEYGNYEIVIVENNSREKKTFFFYEKLKKEYPQVKILTWKGEFNYSAINNFAAEQTDGEYLLFLNNDTEVISRGWMTEMLGICQQPKVGVVGVKLYYPDRTIQHAGVIIGLGGIAGHLFVGEPGSDNGYMARAGIMQNLSAVTAACMMTKRKTFLQAGGFDETLKVALNDVDYCLKAGADGQMVIFTPHAELYHYESKSRGLEDTPEKKARYERETAYFREKWQQILNDGDPFYHPNLSLTSWACALSVPEAK